MPYNPAISTVHSVQFHSVAGRPVLNILATNQWPIQTTRQLGRLPCQVYHGSTCLTSGSVGPCNSSGRSGGRGKKSIQRLAKHRRQDRTLLNNEWRSKRMLPKCKPSATHTPTPCRSSGPNGKDAPVGLVLEEKLSQHSRHNRSKSISLCPGISCHHGFWNQLLIVIIHYNNWQNISYDFCTYFLCTNAQ